jgi:transposase
LVRNETEFHGSELASAIRYARSRWVALTRYLDDGRLEISNNDAERAISR